MTPIERKLLLRTFLIGTLLTALTLTAHQTGWLAGLEGWFFDLRARGCQFFATPTTDSLAHLDIDDPAIDAVGKWPWPRSSLAQVLDEVAAAGAKAVALDILLLEPQEPQLVRRAEGDIETIDHDGVLAATLTRMGNVLVPASLPLLRGEMSVEARVLYDALVGDPQLSLAQLRQRLEAWGRSPEEAVLLVDRHYRPARDRALRERILDELSRRPASVAELDRLLLPGEDGALQSPLRRALAAQYGKARAAQALMRFSRPIPDSAPPLMVARGDELAPLPVFSGAAAAGGFVDYQRDADGAVRVVPMWVNHRNRMVPQMGLSLACLMLGVRVEDLRVEPTRVVIPRAASAGGDVVIPTHRRAIPGEPGRPGAFMHIPWSGPADRWLVLYDGPAYRQPAQHVSVAEVWNARGTHQRLIHNNAIADAALADLLQLTDPDALERFRRQPPAADDFAGRAGLIDATLRRLDEAYPDLATWGGKPVEEEPDADMRSLRRAYRDLGHVRGQGAALVEELSRQRSELRGKLEGRAVLVGWTASGFTDMVSTSLHAECPGVVLHGAIYNGIMTGELWRVAPQWVTWLLTLVMGMATTVAVSWMTPWRAVAAALLLAGGYWLVNGIVLFDYGNLIVGVAGPMLAVGLVWSGGTVVHFVVERAEKARITARFSSYADPALVRYVLRHPDAARADGQVREMSVAFTDLEGFTTLSERLKERTVPLLNQYMERMVPLIQKDGGYVNKFLGDGIMFFHGAPEPDPLHAEHVVAAALRMQQAMVEFNRDLHQRDLPTVAMRIGISTGEMVVGDAGSPDRSDYTVLGDVVNLGARLESANKATGTHILATQRTIDLIQRKLVCRPVGLLQVVGKTQGVMTWEPLAWEASASSDVVELASRTAGVVEAFQRGDYSGCLLAVDELERVFGPSKLGGLYRRLSRQYLVSPPAAGLAGLIVLDSK